MERVKERKKERKKERESERDKSEISSKIELNRNGGGRKLMKTILIKCSKHKRVISNDHLLI